MNKAYRRGYLFENSVRKKFEAKGFYVIRSAGSHGLFDLIAIRKGKVYGIQCKISYSISRSKFEELIKAYIDFGIEPIVAFKDGQKTKLHFIIEDTVKSIDEIA